MASVHKRQPTWLGKSLAGCILGLALAYILIAFFAWYGPGGIDARDKVQFNMWMIPILWLTIFSFTYLFNSAKQAWLILGGLNLILYGGFIIVRGGL
ncbi:MULTISPECIES: hypothetical protein [Pseudoalteromonas]|uniref:Uncharacterized protein n=1 Tax=Pseudoalteromonas arctica TaxID=394751 RepID=A0A7Y0DQW8_9GAMM|nr:hypothetical protein [Pseudoalteromonas arctica]NMM39865.1 hypothetical protein [Pseudoalteromonas arctica]